MLHAGAGARNTIAVAAGGKCGVVATVNDKANTVLNSIRVLPSGAMLSSDKANGRVVKVRIELGCHTPAVACSLS